MIFCGIVSVIIISSPRPLFMSFLETKEDSTSTRDTILHSSRIIWQSCFENFAVYEFVASKRQERPGSLGHGCVTKEISSWHSDHWHLDNLERDQGNRGLNYSHLSRMRMGAWLVNCILKLGRQTWCCWSCSRIARVGWVGSQFFCDNWRALARFLRPGAYT